MRIKTVRMVSIVHDGSAVGTPLAGVSPHLHKVPKCRQNQVRCRQAGAGARNLGGFGMKMRRVIAILIVILTAGGVAAAQDEYTMAVQANPWGFLAGAYGANFEVLLLPSHGLMAEGALTIAEGQRSIGGGVHYRFHPAGELGSFFVGPFAKVFNSEIGRAHV